MTASPSVRETSVGRRITRYGSPSFLRLYALGGCAAVLTGLLASYVSLVAAGNAGIMQTDFVSYYSAAHLVVTGAGSHIYDLPALGHYERALVHPLTVRNGALPYVYPPYVALLFAPLGGLPYPAAWWLWLGTNLLLTAATVAGLQRYLSLGRAAAGLLWAASLSFLPIFVAITQGQISILLLSLVVGAFFAVRSRHPWLAGLLLSLTIAKPQYMVPILVVLAVRRHWAVLGSFTLCAFGLIAGPICIFGPGSSVAYINTLRAAGGWHAQYGYAPSLNQSVAGFVQLLSPPALALALTAMVALVSTGVLIRVAHRSPGLDIPYGLAVVVAVALSPHVLIHDLSLLLLPVAIAVWYRDAGPSHLSLLLLAGSVAILAGIRLSSVIPIQLSVLAMLALGIWLCRVASSTGAAPERLAGPCRPLTPTSRPQSLLEEI